LIKLEFKIVTSRPVEEVFKFLATDFPTTYPLIDQEIIRIEQLEGKEVRVGAIFRIDGMAKLSSTTISVPVAEKGKSVEIRHNPDVGRRYSENLIKIIEYIPNRKFTYIQSNTSLRVDAKVTILFENINDGTRTSWVFEVKLPWWLKLFEPLSRKMAQKEFVQYKEHIRQLLESSGK
jgi:hypothetical protein